jgi:hypothetical protein
MRKPASTTRANGPLISAFCDELALDFVETVTVV